MINTLPVSILVGLLAFNAATAWYLWRLSRRLHQTQQQVLARARQKAVAIIEKSRDQAMDILSKSKISAKEDKLKLEQKLEEITADQLREFQDTLQNVSKVIEGDTQETLKSRAEAELEEYKRARMAEIDRKAQTVLREAIKEVMPNAIAVGDHETLVVKALEEAKRRHVV